jgi:type I restriction enzyme S subunit
MSWGWVNLGKITSFKGGGTPSKGVPRYWIPEIPWASVKDFKTTTLDSTQDKISEEGLRNSASNLIKSGHVIVPTRMALGKAAINTIDLAINQDLRALIPSVELDNRFLLHALLFLAPEIKRQGTGATVKGITQEKLASVKIPLPMKNGKPDLTEQKRIAGILDKADATRRKRQQALQLTDDFLRSLFLDMFGDPVTNPKGWDVRPLSHGVESFEGGKNVSPTETDRGDGIRVLKVSAVTNGEFIETESKAFGEDFAVPPSYLVRKGDLLISRANTSELVGAVAYVWKTSGQAMLPDKLWRFVWSSPARIHPLFMLHMARSAHFRKELIARATGSSGSMKNIGKSKMLDIPIPMPPIAHQIEFVVVAEKVQAQIQKAADATTDSELLFASLQQRAFRGEL